MAVRVRIEPTSGLCGRLLCVSDPEGSDSLTYGRAAAKAAYMLSAFRENFDQRGEHRNSLKLFHRRRNPIVPCNLRTVQEDCAVLSVTAPSPAEKANSCGGRQFFSTAPENSHSSNCCGNNSLG